MADTKISELPAASTPDLTETLPVVQAGATKKLTLSQLISSFGATLIDDDSAAVARSTLGVAALHGFEGRTGSALSLAGTVVTLTVTAQTVWLNGVAYSLTESLTCDLGTPAVGTHFVVAQEGGLGALELVELGTVWSITNLTYTPVATVYWNGSVGVIQEERHGHTRNLILHSYLHNTVGSLIQNDGSFAQVRPTAVNNAQIELAAGTLWDEDIKNEMTTAQGKLLRHWYETASNVWTFADGVDNSGYDRPYLWNGSTSRIQYPDPSNSYTLTDASGTGWFFALWVYASNDIQRPIYIVTPSLEYSTLTNAREATAPVLPFAAELKLLYRWIFDGDGDYREGIDYRTASSLPSGGVSAPVAASVLFSPAGNLEATNVQAALEELDAEKVSAGDIHAATAKTTPVDADELGIVDSAASWVLKKLSWGNLKAAIASYLNLKTATGSLAGTQNISMGVSSLGSASLSGNYNNGFGANTLANNTTGGNNFALGSNALYLNVTGSFNIAIGTGTLQNNLSSSNIAIGYSTLFANTYGAGNAGIGMQSLRVNTSGNYNSCIGFESFYNITAGSYNSAVGMNAGKYQANGSTALQTPNSSVYIGYQARGKDDSDNNSVVIGGNTPIGLGANTTVIGTSATTLTRLYGDIATGVDAPSAAVHAIKTTEQLRLGYDATNYLSVTVDSAGDTLFKSSSNKIRLSDTARTPASATASGKAGEVCWDSDFIYVCTDTDTWKRAALSTW
jgi:hypothetical protein